MNIYKLLIGGYYAPPYCLQEFLHYNLKKYSNLSEKNNEYLISHFNVSLIEINDLIESTRSKNVEKFKNDILAITKPIIARLSRSSQNFDSYFETKKYLTVIVVPFCNRHSNLIELLNNLHGFLQRQYLHYVIVVAEQVNSNDPFNKVRNSFRFI